MAMYPVSINDGGSSASLPHHPQQQQLEKKQQNAQQPLQSDSLDSHFLHLHQQQAQLEAMHILQQQQHILPSIITPKEEQISVLHDPPSGPWSSEDYDSMMRSILDATLPSDHFTDLEAPASLASFSASYAGSYVSTTSDSGASPNSINDLVYGSASFPTPPASDVGSSARNFSFSLTPHNGTAISPDGSLDFSNTSYAQSYSGSDTTSPYAQQFNLHASSSTSPFGLQPVLPPAPLPLNGTCPIPSSQHSDLPTSISPQWHANFLTPTAPGLQPSPAPQVVPQDAAQITSPSVSATATSAKATGRKRRAGDVNSEPKKATAVAASKSESTNVVRISKKAKPNVEQKTASSSSASSINQISSKLPHMEVGSNATALAAIQRLKAKRLQETQAQAAAKAAHQADAAQASSEALATSADKAQLDPATRQQKKVAHNAIERRYRNNINDRIAALRRAVPALREIRPRKTPSGRRSRKAQQEEDLVDGVPAATKLNKATILGKATDYIKYLKSRELRLNSEVAGLRELVRSLEGGEELLELWEGEMDKVVAEQEALAAAAAAREEEEAEQGQPAVEADDDDDDEEDEEVADDDNDEADAAEGSFASASSLSPSSARSRTESKTGRGRKLGIGGAISSVASSRYMLATFLGISFIGSGAEFALDGTASDASQAVARPAAGKVVVGASRQLLKRSATYLAPGTSLAQDAHAFDAVPTHALTFEVLRVVSFAFCFLFLVWPVLSRLFAHSSTSSSGRMSEADQEEEQRHIGESRKLRLALTKGELDVATFDAVVRARVSAPTSTVLALPSVAVAALRLALSRSTRLHKLVPAEKLSDQDAAGLGRLLEVETLCEASSQSSWLLRLETALRVANSKLIRGGQDMRATRDPVLASPRLKATLALSLARLGEGIESIQDLADQMWTEARSSLCDAASCTASSSATVGLRSACDKDERLMESEDASWLSCVLSLDLDSAHDLLASAWSSADACSCDYSAVLAMADVYYCARLTDVWNSLLVSLFEASCPSAAEARPCSLVRDFISLQAKQKLELSIVLDQGKRKELHREITTLARTAPPTARAWQMAQVTLASWSAVLGNLGLAGHVGSMLRDHPFGVEGRVQLSSVSMLDAFVAMDVECDTGSLATYDQLDAKATLFLAWIQFLRTLTDARTHPTHLYAATRQIRMLVSGVTTHSTSHLSAHLDTCLDLVTDLCTALARRLNRLPRIPHDEPLKLLLDTCNDDTDSGIEL